MKNEFALTKATKVLWENRPAPFVYPERDQYSAWEMAMMRKEHMKSTFKGKKK